MTFESVLFYAANAAQLTLAAMFIAIPLLIIRANRRARNRKRSREAMRRVAQAWPRGRDDEH